MNILHSSENGLIMGLLLLLVIVAARTGVSAEGIRIALPQSDLTSSKKALTFTVTVPEAMTGAGSAVIELRRAEKGLEKAPPVHASVNLPPATGAGEHTYRITLDGALLAEGEYTGILTVAVGTAKQEATFTMFRMPDERPKDFPFGIYAAQFNFDRDPTTKQLVPRKEEQLKTIAAMRATGLNVLEEHMQGMGDYTWTMDQLGRAGISFMPSTNTSATAKLTPETQGVYGDGKLIEWPPEWKQHCFFTPAVRQAAADQFAIYVKQYLDHPAFSGKIYFGDDMVLPSKTVEGKLYLTCYCPRCTAAFKQLTGQEPPVTSPPLSGVVPASDPLLQWLRFRSGEVYGGFFRAMEKAKNAVDPSVAIGPIHGWSEQPFLNLNSGSYAPLSQETTAVSSYSYPDLRSPRMDFITQYELGIMNHRDKDAWMLGQITFDSVTPDWHIYQNYWDMLAAGYKLIGYFAWAGLDLNLAKKASDTQKDTPEQWADEAKHIQGGLDALTRVGRHKDWLFPTAGLWSPAETRNAVLYSFTTEAADLLPVNYGGKHQEAVTLFLREALRQHVPMKAICEEEIRAGMLDKLDALCLYDARVLPDDVVALLEAWAAKGGKLYVHNEASLKPKGSISTSMETMIELCGDANRVPAALDNRDVTLRELQAGDAHYFVFANNFTDRYWGIPHYYGKDGPPKNYANLALVRNEPVETTVHFTDKGRYLFDMSTGKAVGSTDAPLHLALEPSWGQALIALPVKRATLKVADIRSIHQGETARYQLDVLDDKGQPVRGAFTVHVTITTPSGRNSRYSCYFGINDGSGQFRLPIGSNDETGAWTVAFEGGFPRTKTTRVMQVVAEQKLPRLLDAQEVVKAAP